MKRRKLHRMASASIVALGVVLMTGKIVVDSEPGLIPLLMVVLGAAWYALARGVDRDPPRK